MSDMLFSASLENSDNVWQLLIGTVEGKIIVSDCTFKYAPLDQ